LKKFVIIVAGGTGSRMGTETPKQFLMLQDKPILLHTIERFIASIKDIKVILILPKNQISYWLDLCAGIQDVPAHEIVTGGETRFHSSLHGIQSIQENEAIVAIHDGVRPFPETKKIQQAFELAFSNGNAVFAVDSKDSIRMLNIKSGAYESIPRDQIKVIQTPQIFNLSQLRKAFEVGYKSSFTDDASVVEYSGIKINLVEGNYENIKITTPEDLSLAEIILKKQLHNG